MRLPVDFNYGFVFVEADKFFMFPFGAYLVL